MQKQSFFFIFFFRFHIYIRFYRIRIQEKQQCNSTKMNQYSSRNICLQPPDTLVSTIKKPINPHHPQLIIKAYSFFSKFKIIDNEFVGRHNYHGVWDLPHQMCGHAFVETPCAFLLEHQTQRLYEAHIFVSFLSQSSPGHLMWIAEAGGQAFGESGRCKIAYKSHITFRVGQVFV